MDEEKLYGSIEILTNKLNPYFDYITTNYKEMYNVANYYIRNCMTGIKKSPELRYANEIEVLHDIFTSVVPLNNIKINNYLKKHSFSTEIEAKEALKNKLFKYPTNNKWFLNGYLIDGIMKLTKNVDYYELPSQVNQNAIYDCVHDWEAYFKSLKKYKIDNSNYTGKPKIPKYKKSNKMTATFTNVNCTISKNTNGKYYLEFPKIKLDGYRKRKTKLCLGKLGNIKICEVKVKPEFNCYRVQIIYEIKTTETIGKVKCGGDIGIDNLITLMDNNGDRPLIVDGKKLKSINQYFNKKIAHLTSQLQKGHVKPLVTSKQIQNLYLKRNNIIKDYMSKAAIEVIRYCLENNIEILVIGENKGWKSEVHLSKSTNQKFCYIPHNSLKQQIKYRCERLGIKIIFREESYTSKCSLLDLDEIPNYGEKEIKFSGKRVKRGLYQSSDGTLINADVNGAGNILRKEYPDAFDKIINFNNPIKVKVMSK